MHRKRTNTHRWLLEVKGDSVKALNFYMTHDYETQLKVNRTAHAKRAGRARFLGIWSGGGGGEIPRHWTRGGRNHGGRNPWDTRMTILYLVIGLSDYSFCFKGCKTLSPIDIS